MAGGVVKIVEDFWESRFPLLIDRVEEAIDRMEAILTLEEDYRAGQEEERLKGSLGAFASQTIDLHSMASVLRERDKSRSLKKGRLQRIEKIFQELQRIRETYQKSPPRCQIVSTDRGVPQILEAAEDHFNAMVPTFRFMRMAALESRARYQPESHDDLFDRFCWDHLDPKEVSLSPPFAVVVERRGEGEEDFFKLLQLVSSGKPVKVFFLQSELKGGSPMRYSVDLELLPLSLREVYLLQTVEIDDYFQAPISQGLASPRPAIFSIFWKRAPNDAYLSRAERALYSRAFPHLVYDPDRSSDFVTRFDLSKNPEAAAIWPRRELEYLSDEGEVQRVEEEFTFADFAVWEADLRDQFPPLPPDLAEERAVPVAEYLRLTPTQRARKVPFVYSVDEEKHLVKRTPSPTILAQTVGRMQLWKSLQEIAGLKNPHVKATESRMEEQRERALGQLRAEFDREARRREETAVTEAMRKLAIRLLGLEREGGAIDLSSLPVSPTPSEVRAPAPPPSAAPEPAPEEAPAGDLPWIETPLCTTCDECMNINKKIFAYNKDKQAYIQDPRGGPFRDIVKAAEKCSAGIIHPGRPLDPKEKDLEKWIKRAEKFQ